MPAFAFRHVKNLHPIFWAKSRELVVAVLQETKTTDSSIVEVSNWASRASLDIIGVAGRGRDFNAIAEPDNDLLNSYKSIFSPSRVGQLLALLGAFMPSWFLRVLP
jgi:hypothetical protein